MIFYQNVLDANEYDLHKVWEEVLRCFWWMQSCYEDVECFNYLGWLARCTDTQASTIFNSHLNHLTMVEFKKAIVKRIRDNGICDVAMRYGEPRLKDLLLLCNAIECSHSKERLRFDLLMEYDIEHIDSQTPNELSSEQDRREWLATVYEEYPEIGGNYTKDAFCSLQDISNIKDVVFSVNDGNNAKDGNGLGNLVLLNRYINRSYKNAVFPRKRKTIHEVLENGSEYVLPCTANAFMK